MQLKEVLKDHHFSPQASEIFLSSGIKTLYPPQAEAIKKGVLKGKSLLMSVPTAAGKTLIAELCMVKTILETQGRCLYIAPLKALASEKFKDFKKKYSSLGIKIGLAIGDLDSPARYLNRYQIIIATAEKVDSLLRSKAQWLVNDLKTVVLDEIHFINDGSRGPTMEILTARIKQLNSKVQFLALSATVENAREMAEWLNSQLVVSSWRPIPLKEGIYFQERLQFQDYGSKMILEDCADDVSKLSMDTLRGKGQVLIFVNSRRSTQAESRRVASYVSQLLSPEEKQKLAQVAKKIAGNSTDATKICHKLAEVVRHGVAFHHAGLKPHQRELVEENFKNNLIKVISCTPTLAAGVNLPARRAIIRDVKRFEKGLGMAYIPTSEYKQCAGRAGRPQYDEYGEAVIIAKSHSEGSTLFERYISAGPEPVISKLDNESALRIHVLSSVAGGYVHDIEGMFEFIAHTFLYHQKQSRSLLNQIEQIFEFLKEEGFIQKSGKRYFATPLGALTSRLYLDPVSSIILRNGLQCIDKGKPFPLMGILHLISVCPDGPSMQNVGKKLAEELEHFEAHFKKDLILTDENFSAFDDYFFYLASLKTTWLFCQWIDEEKEDHLCDFFNVGPGDIYRQIEAATWMLYAAGKIAELLREKKLTFQLADLRTRVRYGVKEELLDIIQLKNVGRIRSRILYDKGFHELSDLKCTTVEKLSALPQIGVSLAKDILEQVNRF